MAQWISSCKISARRISRSCGASTRSVFRPASPTRGGNWPLIFADGERSRWWRRVSRTECQQAIRPATEDFTGILGFIVAEAGRRSTGHIISIDVLPESRRLGIGSQLLNAAEKRLRIALCHTVTLETAVDNGPPWLSTNGTSTVWRRSFPGTIRTGWTRFLWTRVFCLLVRQRQP